MKILIVEDEDIIRKGIVSIPKWQKMGVKEVREARNADEAFQVLLTYHPDIIISDIRMPGLDGIEMCRRITASMPEVKVIFLTGFDEKQYLKGAIEIGAVGYIEKPLSILELEKIIEKVRHQLGIKEETEEHESPEEGQGEKRSSGFLVKKAKLYIENHYQETNLSLKSVAEYLALTPQYLSTLFKSEADVTVGEYMTSCRIEKAKELLLKQNYSIREICELIGYKDSNYFTRLFKMRTGFTPSEFRDQSGRGAG